ncbi:hypothetical protein WJX82_005455 [Trebouxia sp. C0006]
MGVGLGQSASPPNGGQTSGPTLTARQAFCHQAHIVGPKRIDQSPTPFADANIGAIPETLKAREAQWRHIWELASASYLNRQHRVLWRRLMHGSLMRLCWAGPANVCSVNPTHQAAMEQAPT